MGATKLSSTLVGPLVDLRTDGGVPRSQSCEFIKAHHGRYIITVNLDELGPVDWIVVEFPGTKLTGTIAPILTEYIDRGLIRVLDLLFLKKDEDGSFEAFEATDLDDTELGQLRALETELAMVLSEQDVADLAETIEPGSSAAVLVWENLWAAPFAAAVRHAGGQLTASGRIPIQALIAAVEADAAEAEAVATAQTDQGA